MVALKKLTALVLAAYAWSNVAFSHPDAPSHLEGRWESNCVSMVRRGWGSPVTFGLKTTVKFANDTLEKTIDFHADVADCEDSPKATMTILSSVKYDREMSSPSKVLHLDENLVDANLRIFREHGKYLFGQFIGTLNTPTHCLHGMEIGGAYDISSCNMGALGKVPPVGTAIYDLIGLMNDNTLLFPRRTIDDGSQGDDSNMILTGINQFMGAMNPENRPDLLDEEVMFLQDSSK